MQIKKLSYVYRGMKRRCYDPNCFNYNRYGGRGISICDEWLDDKDRFIDWALSNGYQEGLTIDRINNDGNYEPTNCRWITIKENQNNRSDNIKIEIDGEKVSIAVLAEVTGFHRQTLCQRYHRGERGLSLIRDIYGNHINSRQQKPKRRKKIIKLNIAGEEKTLSEWCSITGITGGTLRSRYYNGDKDLDLIRPVRKWTRHKLEK